MRQCNHMSEPAAQASCSSSGSNLLEKVRGDDAVQHSLIHFCTRHRRPADVADEGLVHCLRGLRRMSGLMIGIMMPRCMKVLMKSDVSSADTRDLSHCHTLHGSRSMRPRHAHLAKVADRLVQLLGRAANLLCKLLLRQRLLQLRQRVCLPVAAAMAHLQGYGHKALKCSRPLTMCTHVPAA